MADPSQNQPQQQMVDPTQQPPQVDPNQQPHLVDPNQQQQHLVDPNQQQMAQSISIPVTIQTMSTTDQQQQQQHVAIPIAVNAVDTSSNVDLQQLQQQVDQQVAIQQLQQQQEIQVTQMQVDQIEQQVRQINEEARIEHQQQHQVQIEQQQQQAMATESSVADDNDTVQIPLNPPTDEGSSQLNDSIASEASAANTSTAPSDGLTPTPVKKKRWTKYTKRYNKKWESEPGIKEWIRRVPGDDTKAGCRYCQSAIRAHHTELKKHAQSAKHKSQAAYVVGHHFVFC